MARKIRGKMAPEDRAKQFMPFAALKGFEEALKAKEKALEQREKGEREKDVYPGDFLEEDW